MSARDYWLCTLLGFGAAFGLVRCLQSHDAIGAAVSGFILGAICWALYMEFERLRERAQDMQADEDVPMILKRRGAASSPSTDATPDAAQGREL